MPRPPEPVFLARETYRRRRFIDAMRLVPVVGIGFFVLPVLAAGRWSTAGGGVYIFTVWFGLIVAAALLTRRLARGAEGVGADPLEPATAPAANAPPATAPPAAPTASAAPAAPTAAPPEPPGG